VCLSVFPHSIYKTDAARITKPDTETFNDASWKLIYFEGKRSKVKVTSHKNIACVGFCTLVSVGFLLIMNTFIRQMAVKTDNVKQTDKLRWTKSSTIYIQLIHTNRNTYTNK